MKLVQRHSIQQWIGWWQKKPWRADVALALLVAALVISAIYFGGQKQPDQRPLDVLAFVLLAAGAAGLAFRRRYPGWVLLFANGITLLYVLLNYPKGPNFLVVVVAFYSAAVQGYRLFAWIVLTL